MFSLLKSLVYVLVIIFIGCGIFVWSYRVPMVNYTLTNLLNNPTTLTEVDLSVSLTKINGRNVAIRNPPASEKRIKSAVRAKFISVKLNLRSFFYKPVIIEELYFDQVHFFVDIYSVTGSASNWKTIIYNMGEKARQKRANGLNPKGVIIKKLVIENLIFTYRHPTLTAGSYRTLKPIPRLVIYDVGKGHPVTSSELAAIISQILIRQFATVTGFTDLLRGIPLLPFDILKRIFIRKDRQKASLDEYFLTPEGNLEEPRQLFKKILPSSKNSSLSRT